MILDTALRQYTALLYCFILLPCSVVVTWWRGIGHTSLDLSYRDFEEQSALHSATNTSGFSLHHGVFHYPWYGGGDSSHIFLNNAEWAILSLAVHVAKFTPNTAWRTSVYWMADLPIWSLHSVKSKVSIATFHLKNKDIRRCINLTFKLTLIRCSEHE